MFLKLFLKKSLVFGAAVALALCAAGCGTTAPVEEQPKAEATAKPTAEPVYDMIALDGTTIDGVDVSGLTEQEIRDFFADEARSLGKILVVCGEDLFELDAGAVTGVPDVDAAIAEVYFHPENQEAPGDGVVIALKRTYDLTPISAMIAELSARMTIAPVDATYAYDKSVEGAFVYTESMQGRSVDSAVLFEELTAYVNAGDFSAPMAASFTVTEPAVTLEQAKANTVLISTASSSFAKSNYSAKNRVYNMEKALSMFDGYVLQPGEEFSFNTVLGPRYASHGWKVAGAINNGKSVDEVGGGVCQVSSTAFNAALMADLEIVERAPHSWPLSYLPAGQDATINTGTQDFIFKNNRDTPIILSTTIDKEEKIVTVSVYGTAPADYAYIQLESERTGKINQPEDEIVVDATLKPGETVVDRKGRSGSTYKTYKLYYDANGNLIEKAFAYNTRYRAISTVIFVGPDTVSSVDDSNTEGVELPPADDAEALDVVTTPVEDEVEEEVLPDDEEILQEEIPPADE